MTPTSQGRTGVADQARPEPRRSRLELAVVPAAVRIARHWTADQLGRTGQGQGSADADLIDSAVLAVSELVTNAIAAASLYAAAGQYAAASQGPAAGPSPAAGLSPAASPSPAAGSTPPVLFAQPARPEPLRLTFALPGRILSFGDLPYGPGLPGSTRLPGAAAALPGSGAALPGSRAASGPAVTPGWPAPGRLAAPARVSLVIARISAVVRIEVHDSSRVPLPPMCHRDAEDETGRGLLVVAALAENWGWQPEPSGKVVWCELAS